MKVLCAFQVLVLFVFAVSAQSKIENSPKNSTDAASTTDAASKSLDPTQEQPEDNSDAIRKKKSATATVCVEIRPSGPYQRPFQICEPAAAAPAQGYYAAPTYEEVKPVAAAAAKPAAAYEAPVKGYPAPAKSTAAPQYGSSKPYAAHSSSSYNSVSYRSDDGTEDMVDGEEEHSEHSHEVEGHWARSAGPDYGLPVTYLQPAKHKPKKGHNGLVITCQPSLAGYAATVPSHSGPSLYGGSYGGSPYGSYRSAVAARSNVRYERPSPPRLLPSYGSYGPAPSYKAPAPVYKVPSIPSYSYKAPSPSYSYSAPVYKPAPVYSAPAPSYSAPAPEPTPSYYAPAPAHYTTYSAPAPAPSYSAPQYKPAYASAPQPQYKPVYAPAPQPQYKPVYAPAPAPAPVPAYPQPAPSYGAPSSHPAPPPPMYGPPPPPPPSYGPIPPPPKPHPVSAYSPPQTYRAAEESGHIETNTHMAPSQEEKEMHTIKTMTQIAAARESEALNSVAPTSSSAPDKVKMGAPAWSKIEETDAKSSEMGDMRIGRRPDENEIN